MNCKKCNAILNEGDQFCKNCGASINEVNVQQSQMGVQQQPMGQTMAQPMGQTMSQNNMQQPQQTYGNNINNVQPVQKNNTVKYVVFGVLGVVAIAAIVLVVVLLLGKDNGGSVISGNGGNGDSGIIQTGNTSVYKVNFKGFTLSIPDNLIYQEDNGVLLVGDEEGTWTAMIEIEEGSFSQLKSRKSQLRAAMQQAGYTASEAEEKTYGGVEFITLEVNTAGTNAIAALTKANSMYFMGLTVYNLDNEFDYSLLEKLAPIVSTIKYSDTTTNMQAGNKLDISRFAELAK